MKLLHKLNPFRGKTVVLSSSENGSDFDEATRNPPPRITSSSESIELIPTTFTDDMLLNKPTAAYYVPTQPRKRKPLRSCPGDTNGLNFNYANANRRQSQTQKGGSIRLNLYPLPSSQQAPSHQMKKPICFANQKPKPNSNLSPLSAVLRKYRTPNKYPTQLENTVHYTKYKECKRQCYDAEIKKDYSESMLRRAYYENNRLHIEITKMKCSNADLKSRIAKLEAEAQFKYNCNINE